MPIASNVTQTVLEQQSKSFNLVRDSFCENYYYSDPDIIDTVLGIVAGNWIQSVPIWLMAISAPSSGKSELLRSIGGDNPYPECVVVDKFSEHCFVSGFHPDQKPSKSAKVINYNLLETVNGKVMVTSDFSTTLTDPKKAAAIFGQIRGIYDGTFGSGLGNQEGGLKTGKGKFNWTAGMTPAIDKHWHLNQLGDRFLSYRLTVENRLEHTRKGFDNCEGGQLENIRAELRNKVHLLLSATPHIQPTLNTIYKDKFVKLAEVLATCRTYLERDSHNELYSPPEPEYGTRIVQQLLRVAQSVALIRGKDHVGRNEFELMKRISLDTMLPLRRSLLEALWINRGKPILINQLAGIMGCSPPTATRHLLDFTDLKVVSPEPLLTVGPIKSGKGQHLSPLFLKYLEDIDGIPVRGGTKAH